MNSARVFVTTYSLYNQGRGLVGEWYDVDGIDLDEVSESFDVYDPEYAGDHELMFTDYEGFPDVFYCESGIDFDGLQEFLDMTEIEQLIAEALMDANFNVDEAMSMAVSGEAHFIEGSVYNYVYENAQDLYGFDTSDYMAQFIDWEQVAEDYENNNDIYKVDTGVRKGFVIAYK